MLPGPGGVAKCFQLQLLLNPHKLRRMETPPPAGQEPSSQHSVSLPGIYINSFTSGISVCDVFVVLQRNGLDIGVLNMPFLTAKALGEALTSQINALEARTGQKVLTFMETVAALQKGESTTK